MCSCGICVSLEFIFNSHFVLERREVWPLLHLILPQELEVQAKSFPQRRGRQGDAAKASAAGEARSQCWWVIVKY